MCDISIIIVNWNTRQLLESCIQFIHTTKGELDIELIVVDNASTDGSPEMLEKSYPGVLLISNTENVGFSRANNQGFAASRGRYVLLLNTDAFLQKGTLAALLQVAEANPKIGLVGAQLLNPDGSFQASHTNLPNLWQEFLILSGLGRFIYGKWYPSHGSEEARGPHPAGYVEGACMLARREAYADVQGFEEGYFMYSEDVELCKSMQEHGWQVWYQPAARVVHLGGGSSSQRRPQREADLYQSKVRYYRRHHGPLQANLMKAQILAFTMVKVGLHTLLRVVSGGRYGRTVVSLRYLAARLKEA